MNLLLFVSLRQLYPQTLCIAEDVLDLVLLLNAGIKDVPLKCLLLQEAFWEVAIVKLGEFYNTLR